MQSNALLKDSEITMACQSSTLSPKGLREVENNYKTNALENKQVTQNFGTLEEICS